MLKALFSFCVSAVTWLMRLLVHFIQQFLPQIMLKALFIGFKFCVFFVTWLWRLLVHFIQQSNENRRRNPTNDVGNRPQLPITESDAFRYSPQRSLSPPRPLQVSSCITAPWYVDQEHYYHYTTYKNMRLIRSSRTLKPSNPDQFVGNLGSAVYVTDCCPFKTPFDTLQYELFKYGRAGHKLKFFVKLKKRELERRFRVEQYNDGRRSFAIFTSGGPIELASFEHEIGKRPRDQED